MKNIILILITLFVISCVEKTNETENAQQKYKDSIEQAIREDERNRLEEIRKKEEEEKRKLANKRYKKEEIAGEWKVMMKAIKSDCNSTSKGDIRTENWFINFEKDGMFIKVIGNANTNSQYHGRFSGKELIATDDVNVTKQNFFSTETKTIAKASVNLRVQNENLITGKRELVKEGPCQIEYEITLKR